MFLVVEADGSVRLADPANFAAFHVQAPPGGTLAAVNAALTAAGIGVVDGDHAWIAVPAIASLAAKAGEDVMEWSVGYSAMVDYARKKGWVRTDGHIRAHIEFTSRQ